jgi:hypothetical protein
MRPADFTTLAPGGTLGFLLPDLRSWVQHGFAPGLYTAAATFHNRGAPELGFRTLEEEVPSPAISFRITAAP